MCLQYPNLPKGELLIQYHKTNKIHMKHKVKLLLTVTTLNLSFAISRHSFEAVGQVITSSLYSSTTAWHNSGIKVGIVFWGTRKPNCSVGYLSLLSYLLLNVATLLQALNLVPKIFSVTCRSFQSVAQLCSAVHRTFLVACAGNWKKKRMHVFHCKLCQKPVILAILQSSLRREPATHPYGSSLFMSSPVPSYHEKCSVCINYGLLSSWSLKQ